MIKSEWLNIFKTRKLLVSIIAVLFIPVLYSGMFLWAFWDPYAKLDSLPVALVNEDTGVEYEGESMALGEELTKKLIDGGQFKFEEISVEEADKQLEDMDYYMVIRIPENFSQHATTLLDEEPSKLVMDYIPNEGYNFIGAQIGETAVDRIKAEVNSQVAKTYAEKLFSSITKLGDGFTEAADGADELDNGAQKIADGATDLEGYLQQLASSTVELSDGTDQLKAGAQKAADGATQLTEGMNKLADGSSQLADGAKQAATGAQSLQQGVQSYTDGVAQVAQGQATIVEKQQQLVAGAQQVAQGQTSLTEGMNTLATSAGQIEAGMSNLQQQLQAVMQALPEEQATALQASLGQLATGTSQLAGGLQQAAQSATQLQAGAQTVASGSEQLLAGQQQALTGANQLLQNNEALQQGATSLVEGNATLAEKLTELTAGVQSATTGATELATGLTTLVDGTATLNDGTALLAEKSGELAEGSSTLANGTKDLVEGTNTLASKLQEASEQVDVNPTEKNYEMVGQPVAVEKQSVNHIENYGSGFAPYFISLGLFVGALLISIVYPLVEPAIRPKSATAWYFSKVFVLAIVGIIQALISVAIVIRILGLEVDHLAAFIGVSILTSFTFLAIVQMLVTILGDPGRFVAILILIIQLTTSAGTFPLELIPGPLQVLSPFFPMTYSVLALKASIAMDTSYIWANCGMMAIFMVVCLAVTYGFYQLLFTKRHSKEEIVAE